MQRALPLLFTLLLAGRVTAAEVQVSAAASLTDALTEVGKAFSQTHHIAVRFNFAGSDTLAMQIHEGAPVDVFVSADDLQMDRLDRDHLLLAGSRRTILSNQLVVAVPLDSTAVRRIGDLQQPSIRRIALADPQRVPAGIYARDYLQRIHLWNAVAGKVVPAENVRAALTAVEGGNADAAIVYRTDAMISKRVKVALAISGPDAPHISYPAAVVGESGNRNAALQFVNYLTSGPARAIFTRYGFVVPR
jgi:molybdate transport system substrate-binding protein